MPLIKFMETVFSDYTLRNVVFGSAVLGIISGSLGSFAFLRKQSLVGDAISHAALPGIAMAFILTKSRAPIILISGAFLAGWLGMLFVIGIVNTTKLKDDSALGIILSVFFGFGLVLLTFIQKMPYASQAGLDKFLFGQAATLMKHDVILMSVLGLAALAITLIFWKEFKILCFDSDYALCSGLSVRLLDIVLTTMIVIAIVLGLQTVGVVLMSAMLVAPAAAARQWTNRLGMMVVLAGLFGATAGISGALISATLKKVPTGPAIVLVITIIVFISILFAPQRGIAFNFVRHLKNRKLIRMETLLINMHTLSLKHDKEFHSFSSKMFNAVLADKLGVKNTLRELEARGYVRRYAKHDWGLTPEGIQYAKKIGQKIGKSGEHSPD